MKISEQQIRATLRQARAFTAADDAHATSHWRQANAMIAAAMRASIAEQKTLPDAVRRRDT